MATAVTTKINKVDWSVIWAQRGFRYFSVAMFVTLGLLVFPTQLPAAALKGTVLAFVLVFLARPVAVAIATLPFAYDWRERLILGWAGLRGAVPVVLATFAVIDRVPRSLQFFNLVFFAVLV